MTASTAILMGLGACGGSSDGASASAGGSDAAATSDASSFTTVQEGKLIGLSDMSYPPLESINTSTNEPEGFEIDLADAIAGKLGLQMEWKPPVKFDTIIPTIKQGGTADVGISAFSITPDREEEIDFSDSYLDSNQGVVTRADATDTTEEALNQAGKKISCQSGTTGEDWIRENLTNAECVPLDDPIQAVTGVQTGLYAACVLDLPVGSYLCSQSYTDCQVAIEIPTGEQYGIVVSKDNPGLTAAINKALAELEDDGTLADLETKWFGQEL